MNPNTTESANPKNWPGIPGRSAEHETSPGGKVPQGNDAQVTDAQRQLEKEQKQVPVPASGTKP